MRVAIIHHQFALKGGMETYLLNLIAGFNQQEDEVFVHVYKYKPIHEQPRCVIYRKNLTWLPRVLRKYWFASYLSKQKEMQNYDLTISLMRSFYQKIIICGGTHRGFLQYTKKRPTFFDKMEIAYEQKSYNTSATIVAHSALLKEELINFYNVPREKIVLLYPPIDTNKFNQQYSSVTELRKKFNIHPTKKIILFPSTGHKRKGLYLVIQALKLLPQADFDLIVAGNQLNDISCPNIHYVGFTEDMASLYRACDVTLLPSLYEPFGLVVIESIQCGTPVIVSKFVGAKDLISENEGIILKDLVPSTIAEAIKHTTEKKFSIKPNFAESQDLTVDAHIQKIKSILFPIRF